jgi:hypothetical protein
MLKRVLLLIFVAALTALRANAQFGCALTLVPEPFQCSIKGCTDSGANFCTTRRAK